MYKGSNEKNKVLLIMLLLISILFVGCKSNSNKEEELTLSEALESNDVTFEELGNVKTSFSELELFARKYMGRDYEKEQNPKYIIYDNDIDLLKVPIDLITTLPNISELSEEKMSSDIKKIKYLCIFYNFVIDEYDNFVKNNLNSKDALNDFNKMKLQYKDFIYSSYIEGESKQALAAYFDIVIELSREDSSTIELIEIKKDRINIIKKRKLMKEADARRTEFRQNVNELLSKYYKDAISKSNNS